MLLLREVSYQIAETADINSAYMLDENPCALPCDVDGGTKGSCSRTCRRRRYQHDRPRQQRIGLHNDAEPASQLLVPHTLRQAQLVDVTPAHVVLP